MWSGETKIEAPEHNPKNTIPTVKREGGLEVILQRGQDDCSVLQERVEVSRDDGKRPPPEGGWFFHICMGEWAKIPVCATLVQEMSHLRKRKQRFVIYFPTL